MNMTSYEEMFDEYVKSSAAYCASLFEATEYFFKANAALEATIVSTNTAKTSTIHSIQEYFETCKISLIKTIDLLRTFQEIHTTIPGEQVEVDFAQQYFYIKKTLSCVEQIIQLFSTVRDDKNLQQQIWDNDDFTTYFTTSADSISQAIIWQCNFAKRANLDESI
ncbi:Uncharacterised protein [Gardnerella vaginalis]|jgi:hypothetical protein|uniref:Beta-glucosidase BglX n=6 Tax=Bifidobacteriaceae TaxID=31953 RepID=A0A9X7FFL2_9BIFI|nr:hypothetical protein HMPREF0421_20014 [Gardnerella vaginalis ATCC 14019]APW18200.1 hypothetical protein BVL65_00850 [Gardnerella vaginalis]PMC55286.1 beta-glucosidase BglX [Gardnerella swidsinskii]PNP91381.1 hypothetical protein BFS15_00845 [Gardnerella sp. DNF01162]RFT33323.1 hypothetical protein CG402_05155 [Bifidobacteriaceae bacterium NR020]RIY26964.1 hypothetical protein CJI51_00915 [Bifidobacteriaceae bacterium WP021]RIY29016.1 hypothetical protein CJI49_05650 [Bifidobacteriaceae bac